MTTVNEYYLDGERVMVRRPAGGHGGGVTSSVVEPASPDEARAYLDWSAQNEVTQATLIPAPEPEPVAEPEAPRAE